MAPPVLRNLLQRQLYKDLGTGLTLGLVCGFAWKFGYADPKRAKFAEFYKNYDAEKVAKEMEAELEELQKEYGKQATSVIELINQSILINWIDLIYL